MAVRRELETRVLHAEDHEPRAVQPPANQVCVRVLVRSQIDHVPRLATLVWTRCPNAPSAHVAGTARISIDMRLFAVAG